jgi:PPOX class probable F420-dependent enzyme
MALMSEDVLPAESSALGAWVRERLRQERIAWLTTVDSRGIAQPNPVWFLWDGDSILVYNLPTAHRLTHIRQRPHVTLHLDSYGRGGDAVVVIGVAEIVTDVPTPDRHPAFLAKYRDHMGDGAADWARIFTVAMRIRPTRFRGFHQAGPNRPGVD